MNTILYIGNFSFPLGNAAGKRVYANGKILRELGYEVIFIGMSDEINDFKLLESTKEIYDGFTYYNLAYPNSSLDWIKYKSAFLSLDQFLIESKVIDELDLVIYYGSPRISLFDRKLIRYCNKRKIKIISDCVDWLTVKTNNPIFDIIKWVDNTYQKVYINKKADGVIAISKYLSNYYKKSGKKTIVVPPLAPIKYNIPEFDYIGEEKIITYAGLPFRKGQVLNDCNTLKDRIDKTIILLNETKKCGCKFIFNVYGFTKDEYLEAIPQQEEYINELGNSIRFYGYRSNEEVVESIRKSHFTILIRDINRDTMAGFPTKVSESISCGTPVITTRTSDLEDYIIEGKNGFFMDIDDSNNAKVTLRKVLEFSREEIDMLKRNCNEFKKFHYENYIDQVENFLLTI